jgi:hypothetical protein
MSTRSAIAYEDDNGNCVGVYCHFDGYPSHMFPIIKSMQHEEVKSMVETALVEGGLRSITNETVYETYKEKGPRGQWLYTSIFAHENNLDYTYFKRKDGSVFATCCDGREITHDSNY